MVMLTACGESGKEPPKQQPAAAATAQNALPEKDVPKTPAATPPEEQKLQPGPAVETPASREQARQAALQELQRARQKAPAANP